MKLFSFLISAFLICPVVNAEEVSGNGLLSLEVSAAPARSTNGHLIFNLYNDQKSYDSEGVGIATGSVDPVKGTIQFVIEGLEAGTYALTMFHDENDNGKIDRSVIGKPKEFFGISNITKTLWSKPSWDEVKFEIKPDQKNEISILLKIQ